MGSVLIENRMTKKRNLSALSAIDFCRKSIKFLLLGIALTIVFIINGYDITSWLAAIGIGGIAIALGAQKTIENIVGSINVLLDQPVRVGDFCQVGDIQGTIEQIGIRSTRIRTLTRTIVTIPNGDFSSEKIENYTYRDNYRFHSKLGVRYETSPSQLRFILAEIKSMLTSHNQVLAKPNRVRLVELGADSIIIEIHTYIKAEDFESFLIIKEELILKIMDIIESSGTTFAFPSQTVYLSKDSGVSQQFSI